MTYELLVGLKVAKMDTVTVVAEETLIAPGISQRAS